MFVMEGKHEHKNLRYYFLCLIMRLKSRLEFRNIHVFSRI